MKQLIVSIVFTLLFFFSCSEPTKPKPPNGPDTTSHEIVWQTFKFGHINSNSSACRDVFVLNNSSVYSVGEINTEETYNYDSLGNWIPPYNAVYWNGDSLSLHRIGDNDNDFHNLEGIFSFTENDLWVTTSVPRNWNGTKWTKYHLWNMGILDENDGGVPNIWGTNSLNMYFSGQVGTIVKYDGRIWQKIESGTELTLKDIYGFSDSTVYTVGYDELKGSVVVRYNGTSVSTNHFTDGKLNGVWGSTTEDIYIIGDGLFQFKNNSLTTREYPSGFPKYHMECIRGTGSNNIFVAGHGGFVMHYNGKSWHYYPELQNDIVYRAISVNDKVVAISGFDGWYAYLTIGELVE